MTDQEIQKRIAEQRLNFYLSGKARPLNRGVYPDPLGPERDWRFATTSIMEGWLLLQCRKTKAFGAVKEPTQDEWTAACAFREGTRKGGMTWPEYWRVTLLKTQWQ